MRLFFFTSCLFMLACSSAPKDAQLSAKGEPSWAQQGTRFIEGNRIVYVGRATATTKEDALFKAEGSVLEDIANECSLIPKSTQLESRYSVRGTYEFDVRVKMSVESAECELSRQAAEPSQIRYYANTPLTVQLLQFQDRNEGLKDTGVEIVPPTELPDVPERDSHWDDTQHYYVLKQTLVYLKMFAVLSPADAYAPFTMQSKQYAAAIQQVVRRINSMQINNPALREKPMAWSTLPDRPRVGRPDVFAKRALRKKGGPVKQQPQQFPKRNSG